MAYNICEHCHAAIKGSPIYRNGFYYHKGCLKCYVCSETDLKDSEVFKGVIFCSSCSQRIFESCVTVRRTKCEVGQRGDEMRSSGRERHRRSRQKSLTSFESSRSLYEDSYDHDQSLKYAKDSVDIGVSTDVTQTMLDTVFKDSLIMDYITKISKLHGPSTQKKKPRQNCDDLRMAELGASTEIANMALYTCRRKTLHTPSKNNRAPLIIKNSSRMISGYSSESSKKTHTRKPSFRTMYYSRRSTVKIPSRKRRRWPTSYAPRKHQDTINYKDISSVLKTPFREFRKRILKRSSLISCISRQRRNNRIAITEKLFRKTALMNEHQRQGLRVLYTAINHRRTPYKLGWLDLMSKSSCCIKSGDCTRHPPRCRHYRRSHTYRYMRKQTMKLAGPTKSQLEHLRGKLLKKIFPPPIQNFLKAAKGVSLVSVACGTRSDTYLYH